MKAALKGHIDIVRTLLEKGVDVNAKRKNGDTALTEAKKNDHKEIVSMLKEAGARE